MRIFYKIMSLKTSKIKQYAITVGILVILSIINIIIIFLAEWQCLSLPGKLPQIALYIFITPLVIGILYFLFEGVVIKKGRKGVIPSVQIFLVFIIINSLVLKSGWHIHFYHGALGAVPFYIMMFLPELAAFIGLAFVRKRNYAAGAVLVLAAIVFAFEIVPLRVVFFNAPSDVIFLDHADLEHTLAFGKKDREFEFIRSLEIIQNLSRGTEEHDYEALEKVIICMPNLEEYPDILKLVPSESGNLYTKKYWHEMKNGFKEKEFLLNTTIDTDEDGLTDFKEAQLLSDAYNPDTDGDGIEDGEDTDPLNQLIISDYADIHTQILQSFDNGLDTSTVYLVENSFSNGHGEFASFDRHVVILCADQVSKWSVIFNWQNFNKTEVERRYLKQDVSFGRYVMDVTRRLAIIGVIFSHGGGASSGLVFLLIKLPDGWCILAINRIWG